MSTTMSNRACAIATLLAGAGLGALPEARAGTYELTKTITWNITDTKPGADGRILGGNGSGMYRYFSHACSDDAHIPGRAYDDAGASAWQFENLHKRLKKDGDVKDDVPDAPYNVKWNEKLFDQGLRGVPAGDQLVKSQRDGDASQHIVRSHAESTISVSRGGQGGAWTMQGTLDIRGAADVSVPHPNPPKGETAYSEAASGAYLKLTGVITQADWVSGENGGAIKIQKGQTDVRSVGGAGELSGEMNPKSQVSDPVRISYFDELSGELFGSSVIYSDSMSVEGNAGISWDPLGDLLLTASAGSSAELSITTPSSWVLNPFNATASIDGGLFAVTGDLAGLPWAITTDPAGTVTARLALAAVPHDFEFDYDASGLGTPAGDLIAQVESDANGVASDIKSNVPAPGSAALLAVGLGVIAQRRR